MKQMIYRSQPFGFDRAMLAGILTGARRNNGRDGITGALICRQDLYLQLIEGPAPAIDACFARIGIDDRHSDVRLLLEGTVSERMFPRWEMLDDQAPALSWSPAETAAGAIEAASPAELVAVFSRLAASAA
jgi:hypothetical protein